MTTTMIIMTTRSTTTMSPIMTIMVTITHIAIWDICCIMTETTMTSTTTTIASHRATTT